MSAERQTDEVDLKGLPAALLPFRGGKEKKMAKYRYGFVDGAEEIDISEEWAAVLREMDRAEEACRKKETRRHISLDAVDFEGEEFAEPGDAETALLEKESDSFAEEFLSSLTDVQRRRVEMRMEGRTYREIAAAEGSDFRRVEKSVNQAREKIRKIISAQGGQNFPFVSV